jgi:nucleoid-associated protein YgaU
MATPRPPQFGRKPQPEKFIAEHTVESGESLSGIALKYYKSAAKEDWMAIYEANKSVIGDDPNVIKPGMVLKIPER